MVEKRLLIIPHLSRLIIEGRYLRLCPSFSVDFFIFSMNKTGIEQSWNKWFSTAICVLSLLLIQIRCSFHWIRWPLLLKRQQKDPGDIWCLIIGFWSAEIKQGCKIYLCFCAILKKKSLNKFYVRFIVSVL